MLSGQEPKLEIAMIYILVSLPLAHLDWRPRSQVRGAQTQVTGESATVPKSSYIVYTIDCSCQVSDRTPPYSCATSTRYRCGHVSSPVGTYKGPLCHPRFFNQQSTTDFSINCEYHCTHPTNTMRFSVVLATFIASVALAMPDPLPQGYTGPCSNDNCGVTGQKCTNQICVPWPHTDLDKRKGCTCSNG